MMLDDVVIMLGYFAPLSQVGQPFTSNASGNNA